MNYVFAEMTTGDAIAFERLSLQAAGLRFTMRRRGAFPALRRRLRATLRELHTIAARYEG